MQQLLYADCAANKCILCPMGRAGLTVYGTGVSTRLLAERV